MAEEQRQPEAEPGEAVYKTKAVQFLGRSTPIVLQNDNGPCPLLAICNVLLLRNNINLSLDATEVSQQKLLSLVAERLIDSNSNVQDKDDVYVNNQQQNIADAIDLLPRLATGIDVNVHFRKINDFEFTRECTIFDLLDIPLYHGWIVDSQDTDTASVIGAKSYNTLVAELVAFETRNSEGQNEQAGEEDSVDFVAATTATLGVPSPSLSRGRSLDDSPVSAPVEERRGRGDIEEEEELMRVLSISKTESPDPVNASVLPAAMLVQPSPISEESTYIESSISGTPADLLELLDGDESDRFCKSEPEVFASGEWITPSNFVDIGDQSLPNLNAVTSILPSDSGGLGENLTSHDSEGSAKTEVPVEHRATRVQSSDMDGSDVTCTRKDSAVSRDANQSIIETCRQDNPASQTQVPTVNMIDGDTVETDSCSNGRSNLLDVPEAFNSGFEVNEPIYQGEEHILNSRVLAFDNTEPVYEGEVVLAEQAGKTEMDTSPRCSKDAVAHHQWQLIKSFLENNASQLTVYGLLCLQEGLKERELCVFFRNNHFGTMFKYNGELYLLATDQGYINQPDLVWEKLNEVNGDTVFMTGNFTRFNPENRVSDSWNEQQAMTSTADYLATLGSAAPTSSDANSDLQLAIALQQQEFEQQPQQSQRQHQQQSQQSQQSPATGRSRLVVGPQAQRASANAPPQRSDSKSKDKCTVM